MQNGTVGVEQMVHGINTQKTYQHSLLLIEISILKQGCCFTASLMQSACKIILTQASFRLYELWKFRSFLSFFFTRHHIQDRTQIKECFSVLGSLVSGLALIAHKRHQDSVEKLPCVHTQADSYTPLHAWKAHLPTRVFCRTKYFASCFDWWHTQLSCRHTVIMPQHFVFKPELLFQ